MMQSSFQNILVPVDFSPNTEVAVSRALDVIGKRAASLHLLHVQKGAVWSRNAAGLEDASKKLWAWKEILEEAEPALSVHCEIHMSEAVEKSIRRQAAAVDADLIVVAKKPRHRLLRLCHTVNTARLAHQSGRPVLTVRPGSLNQAIKTVVVPVSEGAVKQKMEALALLCGRMRPVVHLVAFSEKGTLSQQTTNTLLRLFKWIQDTLHCPVEYALLEGGRPARQLVAYAEKMGADVLLVHPGRKGRLGFWNRPIQDVLPAHSKIQVLTVHQSTINKTITV